jgi:hypothetical protein
MKPSALLLACLLPFAALADRTTEVLVTTAGTQLPKLQARRGLEVYNNGPNAICCAFATYSATAVSGNSCRPIAAGASWAVDARDSSSILCKATSANQVTGAATIVSEVQ